MLLYSFAALNDPFFFTGVSIGTLGFGAAIALIFLLIFIRRPGWKEYQYFLLQLIPGFFVVYQSSGFEPLFESAETRIKVLGFMWTALVLFHLTFLHRLYKLERKKMELALWVILVINTILIFVASDLTRHSYLGIIVILSITPLAFYNISIHAGRFVKGNIYAKFLLIPGVVLSLSAAHDGICYLPRFGGPELTLFGYSFDRLIFGYCSFMMFVGGAIILVHRFMNTMDEVETLNATLEEKVAERTQELEKSLNDLSNIIENIYLDQQVKRPRDAISAATEEKIKKAIIYINENYMEQISREGLAASLDINHDHLSKSFKIYTGKKIIEYINELRVKRAVLMLKDPDKTIITIAYDVGFESLRTFNRAFVKVMGVTPSEFRGLNSGG
ncbi:MAG: helix-turn-helix transcriptional regulator [bacterium]|nr:helix-turn-helix transcriptional regulator [bacterium]